MSFVMLDAADDGGAAFRYIVLAKPHLSIQWGCVLVSLCFLFDRAGIWALHVLVWELCGIRVLFRNVMDVRS